MHLVRTLAPIGFVLTQSLVQISFNQTATAQIVPDVTIPLQLVTGVVTGLPATLLNGGVQRGPTLFHSFQEFNVGLNDRVYFNNPSGISTILSRVTGANPSNIFGTLGVAGSANLYLINPRGIVFGKDAKLDIAGSFVASTADRWMLGDGTAFQATNPNAPPLLTVDVSPGLQYGAGATSVKRSGAITNFGKLGVGGSAEFSADRIEFQNGILDAVRDVTLYAPTIILANQSFVSTFVPVNGTQNGDILIRTQSLKVTEGSEIIASTFSSQGTNAGNVFISPIDPTQISNVVLSGYVPFKGINANGSSNGGFSSGVLVATENPLGSGSQTTGNGGSLLIDGITNLSLENGAVISGRSRSSGTGGNVFINVTNLSITGGAQITVPSYKTGTPGNMVINAETIAISGSDPTWSDRFKAVQQAYLDAGKSPKEAAEQAQFTVDPFGEASGLQSSLLVGNGVSTKNAGIILVNASKSISLNDGADISSSTFGKGNGGFISISSGKSYPTVQAFFNQVLNTYESLDFDTKLSLGGKSGSITLDKSSYIRSTVHSGAEGNAGTIHISTGNLNLNSGSQIQTLVFRPSATEGGAKGNAGSIWIKSDDSVRLSGKGGDFYSGILSSIESGATGEKSGIIEIKTPLLYLNNGSFINTSNLSGGGSTGYVRARTDFTVLDRNSSITSDSLSGQGGNVRLESRYLLGVSRNSQISTTAGNPASPGNGGNISIGSELPLDPQLNVVLNSTLLTYAFPYKNSDIKANAFGDKDGRIDGKGGRIDLSSLAIRNLAVRKDTIISDDLDASSSVGLDGVVNVNTFNLDVDRGLQPINDRFRDYVLSEGCDPRTRQEVNSLKQIGTGTIAQDSTQQLDRRTVIASNPSLTPTNKTTTERPVNPIALIPAQGWTQTPDGKLQFIAASLPYVGSSTTSNTCSYSGG